MLVNSRISDRWFERSRQRFISSEKQSASTDYSRTNSDIFPHFPPGLCPDDVPPVLILTQTRAALLLFGLIHSQLILRFSVLYWPASRRWNKWWNSKHVCNLKGKFPTLNFNLPHIPVATPSCRLSSQSHSAIICAILVSVHINQNWFGSIKIHCLWEVSQTKILIYSRGS